MPRLKTIRGREQVGKGKEHLAGPQAEDESMQRRQRAVSENLRPLPQDELGVWCNSFFPRTRLGNRAGQWKSGHGVPDRRIGSLV